MYRRTMGVEYIHEQLLFIMRNYFVMASIDLLWRLKSQNRVKI
jgi:hypothetical protein